MHGIPLVEIHWPAPDNVRSVVTTRTGGFSMSPFDSLNLAQHVEDDETVVSRNRLLLQEQYPEIRGWQWLQQVHSATVHRVDTVEAGLAGDALVTDKRGLACCILTADCLPVLICDQAGTEIAAAHGGWRGLAAGIIANTLKSMRSPIDSLLVWLGPAIGPRHFEVGAEVRDRFLATDSSRAMDACFTPKEGQKYMADLYGIARAQLLQLGVERVFGGGFCTYSDHDRFFSFRRDGRCGRTLSAIYLL